MLAIIRDKTGNYRQFIGSAEDSGFVKFIFNRDKKEGDILDTITQEQWESIAANERYKLACMDATSAKMEASI